MISSHNFLRLNSYLWKVLTYEGFLLMKGIRSNQFLKLPVWNTSQVLRWIRCEFSKNRHLCIISIESAGESQLTLTVYMNYTVYCLPCYFIFDRGDLQNMNFWTYTANKGFKLLNTKILTLLPIVTVSERENSVTRWKNVTSWSEISGSGYRLYDLS